MHLEATNSDNPFRRHPVARYRWAYDRIDACTGPHLDFGSERGEFLRAISASRRAAGFDAVGADCSAEYLAENDASSLLVRTASRPQLPFADGAFDSVSALDVLEHTPDDGETLRELARVLVADGTLVLTVPQQHVLSILDPDNAKFRFPRLHRWVYTKRFGVERYHQRFEDTSDDMLGDLHIDRGEHTNYRFDDLASELHAAGFEVVERSGANFLWRFFDIPRLLLPAAWSRVFDPLIRLDGELFTRANLFVVARKREMAT